MMNRPELMELVKNGKKVTLMLTDAKVVSVKTDWKVCKQTTAPIANASSGFYNDLKPQYGHTAQLFKIVVVDPVLGAIYFSGFSEKLSRVEYGSLISLKVTVTGMGDATAKYPDPILFAKPHLRGSDTITSKPAADALAGDVDISVNV